VQNEQPLDFGNGGAINEVDNTWDDASAQYVFSTATASYLLPSRDDFASDGICSLDVLSSVTTSFNQV